MDQGIYTAAAGAIAMEDRLDIIANNLANLNTTGFKKDKMSFEQFSKILDTASLYPGQYQVIPVDVISASRSVDTTPGLPQKTGNPLDVAILGEGFFVVNTDNGTRYTRAGSFQLTTDNMLVTPEGYTVQGQGGDITIDPQKRDIVIDSEGKITQEGDELDSLMIVNIPPDKLVRQNNGLFTVRQGFTPEPVETPFVSQGYIEAANVEPVKEMVQMINTERAYEVFQKVIRNLNDAYSYSIRNVGTVA